MAPYRFVVLYKMIDKAYRKEIYTFFLKDETIIFTSHL